MAQLTCYRRVRLLLARLHDTDAPLHCKTQCGRTLPQQKTPGTVQA